MSIEILTAFACRKVIDDSVLWSVLSSHPVWLSFGSGHVALS